MTLKLDHVAFGVRETRAMAGVLSRLGFTATPPSHCTWEIAGRVQQAPALCVAFREQYLDFVQIAAEAWTAHLSSSSVYAGRSAPSGIVLSGEDPDEAHGRWRTSVESLPEPYTIARRFDRPGLDGSDYRFLSLVGCGLPLGLIADRAPRSVKRSAWWSHANSARGIRSLDVVVPALADAVASLRPFGLEARSSVDDSAELDLGRVRLVLWERPQDDYLRGVDARLPDRERPRLAAVDFEVTSLEQADRVLSRAGVDRTGDGSAIRVDPELGLGTGVRFVPRVPRVSMERDDR